MLTFRPQVQARDPRASAPKEIVLDGQLIGTVTKWDMGMGPSFTAAVNLGGSYNGILNVVFGSGPNPEAAIAKALAEGVDHHATCLARARALEARIGATVPA